MTQDIISPKEASDVLHALGYWDGPPFTSLTDPKAKEVSALYQGDMGLNPDGSVGPMTTEVMRSHQAQLSKMPSDFKFAFRWKVTGYYVPSEADYPDSMPTVVVPATDGSPLAAVPWRFFADAALEGTAHLKDGRLINVASVMVKPKSDYSTILAYAQKMGWVPVRPGYAGISVDGGGHVSGVEAFSVVPQAQAGPYGYGVIRGVPLQPWKTMATDTGDEPWSEPRFKGKGGALPRGTQAILIDAIDRHMWDGSVHDGKVVGNDTGGGINGAHSDWFCGGAHSYALGMRGFPQRAHMWWPGCEAKLGYGYGYCLYKNPFEK